jgi:Transposase and inactivated derivatives
MFGSDGRRMVRRKKNTELESKNLIPTVKHWGGDVLVWTCMSATGVGILHFIEGIMNHIMYIDILKENLRSSAIKIGMGNQFIFQQDNVPKQTARKVKEWLLYNMPNQLHSPSQSPDMNPIENLWSHLKIQIRKRQIKSTSQLKAAFLEEWKNISLQTT